MKRIRITAAVLAVFAGTLFGPPAARAQGSRHDDVVRGEQGIPVAGATVAVCTQPANVTITPCTPLANLYTDASLTTPAPNPLTSDGLGNFHFYAAPGLYTVQVYGPGINTYTTPDVLLPTNPANAQFGSITATNGITALTLSLGGNLSVAGNANVTGTLTAGSLAANLGASSNAELKPFTGDAILYVSPSGSDSNDGKSPGTAMATIYHAACSLPGGNCASQIHGKGTVYFFDGSAANATATCGFWLLGPNDPNYSSPPACWLKQPNSGAPGLAIVGIPSINYGPNAHRPSAHISGGSTSDRNHPALWFSGTTEPIEIDNLDAGESSQRGTVIGECSGTDTRTGTCVVSDLHFINDHMNIPITAGYGPAWDITGQSFWIRIQDSGGQGTDSVNTATGDLAPAILVDGRTNLGNYLLFVDDFNASNGGIKFYPGSGGGGLSVTKLTTEAQNGEPAVWFVSTGGSGDSFTRGAIQKVEVADAVANPTPAVESDISTNGSISASDIFGVGTNIVGSVVSTSQYSPNLQNQVISPLRSGQQGFINGWVYGNRDDVQRNGGLTDVRFANAVAGSACSSWQVTQFSGTSTKTCAIADPFGGTNAGQASSTVSSPVNVLQFLPGSSGYDNVNLTVGEYIIGGVWTRSATASGYPNSAQVGAALAINSTPGFALSGGCSGDSVVGDGQWTWNRCVYKVTAVGTNPASLYFGVQFNSAHTVQAYGPVINFIAAGALSDNEAYAYENALKSYDASCTAGTACGMQFNPIEGSAFESVSANPAQSGILRIADGDALAWRNHANTADVILSKNTSDQLVAPPFASPTFFSPIIDSASGASGVTFRNSGSSVWTANAAGSGLSFNFNAHLGETTMKLAPFGGQSYAGLLDNYGMSAGFVAVTEAGGTMSFDAGLGNTFEVTLNANATSSTLSNAQPGQWLHVIVCQPSSGGPFTFAWPSGVRGAMTVGTTAGKCTAQSFVFDGTSAFATSPGVSNQ